MGRFRGDSVHQSLKIILLEQRNETTRGFLSVGIKMQMYA